ncbi:hypothetical protein ABTL25_19540, partial [Acinetobacter baumannii]
MTLDREVDVGVRVGFPALAAQDPARLAAATGVAAARNDIAFVARVIDRPDPAPDFTYVEARGPFMLDDELALMDRHGIRSIVT